MAFEQAGIAVEKEAEFAQLKDAVTRGFQPERVGNLFKRLQRTGSRIRDWESVLKSGVLEQKDAASWYQALSLSDQAQMREFYLSRLEDVAPELRTKYHKLYQYY